MNRTPRILFADRPGIRISRVSEHLVCSAPDDGASGPCSIPFSALSGMILSSQVACSPAVLIHALKRGIRISFCSPSGEPAGFLVPVKKHPSPFLWKQMYAARSPAASLRISCWLVSKKIAAARKLIRSWATHHHSGLLKAVAADLCAASKKIPSAVSHEQLRGIEGEAAKRYWLLFRELAGQDFFPCRSGHPPASPANAMLSFGYTVLAHQIASGALNRGFDLSFASLHRDSVHYAPLPWDLIEPLRAPVVDRVVIAGIHRKRFVPDDFLQSEDGVFSMKDDCRKNFLRDLCSAFSDPSGLFRCSVENIVNEYADLISECCPDEF